MWKRILAFALALQVFPGAAYPAVPGGVVITATRLAEVPGLDDRLIHAFGSPPAEADEGPSALLRSKSSVAMAVVSYAEIQDETVHAPDPEVGDFHLRHIPVGGALVVIAPLSRSIVAVSPVFWESGWGRPTVSEPSADLAAASVAFVHRALERLASLEEEDAIGASLWQVTDVSITSKIGRQILGEAVDDHENVLALVASDIIGASGRVALPPKQQGEAILRAATLQFAAIHGLADSEIERFSVSLPAARNQLQIVVDGFNSVVVEGLATRARAYKAWATVIGGDRKVEASAVVVEKQLTDGIQSDGGILETYVRQAMVEAVKCAMHAVLDLEVSDSCET